MAVADADEVASRTGDVPKLEAKFLVAGGCQWATSALVLAGRDGTTGAALLVPVP
jgi:hypothetical protein